MENNGLGSVETNPLSSPHSPDPVEASLVDEQLSHATMLTRASPEDETSSSELHDFNAFHAFRDAMDRTREFCRKQKAHFWKVLAALLWLLLVMNVVVGVALTVEFRTSNIVRNFDTLRSMKRIRNVMFIISGIAALAAFVTLVALLLRDSGLRDRRGLRGPIAIGDASSGEDQVPKCDREDETVEGANSALIWKPKAREWISVNFRKGCWSPWHRTVLGWALLLACVATWLLGLLFLTRHVNIRRSVKAEKAGSMSRMRFIFLVVVATVGVTMFVVERAIDSGSWKNRPVCISRRGAIVGKAADSYCVGRWFSSVALESPYSEVVVYDDVSREWELLVLPWKMLGGTNRCYYHDPLHGYTGSAAMYVLPPVICYLLGLPTVAIVFSVLAVLLPVEKPRGAFNVLLLGPWGEGALVLPRTLWKSWLGIRDAVAAVVSTMIVSPFPSEA
uniref:Uncharacterized protein n=1 Tax=Pinguiococcus pyrenoidosus TaxID=172671 RepID=A0A7R9YAB5_9STRA|mmetsp:Transcript_14079/g.52847  ORF Transcript_14079/g.52847 Transcript_14079/m.52847 type:complete len:448 (+) Transcript_14079:157-1500(+)